jgi:glycosyltransferase involved in cell wall biosynthesis
MRDFYHQRFNILVCTTIVESGIDVPSANTIVIHRADKLGLAQLHQLRGRVGRSHHRAYEYLITPPPQSMTADAKKRLEAIESLEDLGAGFTLATHDLEIRGAGELLGEEQSGQITEIGFSLYMDLLERAAHVREHVIELPRCSDVQLATYLHHAQALLFPSFAEGYGLPLVEALSAGTPVIASDLPVFKEIAGDIPDYLDPLDGLGWLSLIEAYSATGSAMRDAQKARMRQFVSPSWQQHFEQVDALLEKLS